MNTNQQDRFPARIGPPPHERTGSPPALEIVRTGNPVVDSAGELAAREREAFYAVSREIEALRESNAKDKAADADADAFAAARVAGRKDPGPVATTAHEALVADLIRRRNGLRASVAIRDGAFRDAVREHSDQIRADSVARLDGDELRAAAEVIARALNNHADATSYAIWVQAGPGNPRNKPRPALVIDGTRYKVQTIVQALLDLANAPTGFEPVAGNRFHDPADPSSLEVLAAPGVPIPPRLRTRGPGGDGPPSAA